MTSSEAKFLALFLTSADIGGGGGCVLFSSSGSLTIHLFRVFAFTTEVKMQPTPQQNFSLALQFATELNLNSWLLITKSSGETAAFTDPH